MKLEAQQLLYLICQETEKKKTIKIHYFYFQYVDLITRILAMIISLFIRL